MTKLSFPYVEDYIEVIGGLRDITGKKIPFLSKSSHPTVSLARYDVNIASSFANQADSGTSFTDRQSELAIKLIEKYRKQLYNLGIDVDPILKEVKFRMPIRVVDRTRSVRIEDGMIHLRFPYDKVLVPEITKASKASRGTFKFNMERKIWLLALTEYNVNWVKAFGQLHQFEIDPEVDRLMEKILECEKTDYKIELTLDSDNNIIITNGESSMMDYISEHVGELNYSNLIKLVDHSAVLGYTVNNDILEAVQKGFDPTVAGLLAQKESHVKRIDVLDQDGELMDSLTKYAELTDRWPICIYEPDLSDRLLKCAKERFGEAAVLRVGSTIKGNEVDMAGVKCVYFNKLKRSWPHAIPIFVSTNAMLYGAEKQAIIQLAEKVVYYTATVYNQEAKEIVS
jgi:hypothetical protein